MSSRIPSWITARVRFLVPMLLFTLTACGGGGGGGDTASAGPAAPDPTAHPLAGGVLATFQDARTPGPAGVFHAWITEPTAIDILVAAWEGTGPAVNGVSALFVPDDGQAGHNAPHGWSMISGSAVMGRLGITNPPPFLTVPPPGIPDPRVPNPLPPLPPVSPTLPGTGVTVAQLDAEPEILADATRRVLIVSLVSLADHR